MSTTASNAGNHELVDLFDQFYQTYYREDILELAGSFPKEQKSLFIDWTDVLRYDPSLAEDLIEKPDKILEFAESALSRVTLPVDIDLSRANVRVRNLNEMDTFYPGEFSPTERHNERPLMTVEGQVQRVTEVYPKILHAAFECQLCGTITEVPQSDHGHQKPHQCQGCERQGPFKMNFDQSEFVDAQTIRVQEPPEVMTGGTATTLDIHVEDDITGIAEPGDRVGITGRLRMDENSANQNNSPLFDIYLEGQHIKIKDTDFESITIDTEDKEEIKKIAQGEYGELFEVIKKSIAPKLVGEKHDLIKEAIFLQLVSGSTVELPSGGKIRGIFHTALIGDGSTGKSKLLRAASKIAPRSVYANGKGATEAGMTASVVQDDFGDGNRSVAAGALVQAHKGLACIDEIDKVKDEVQDAMHGAMEDMIVDVNKWGINTSLPAETSVLAAGNPKHSRWEDDYEPIAEQITLSETLLQRFALIFKLEDKPDEDRDRLIGDHTLQAKEAAKAMDSGESADQFDVEIDPLIDHEMLRKYIAYARKLPNPRFKNQEDRNKLRESYVKMRGVYDYQDGAPVPIAPRKLEDMHRIAEASARARLSEWIQPEDIKRAKWLIGQSLKDYGMNEDGEFDADVIESGRSKSQAKRMEIVKNSIDELQVEHDRGVPYETLINHCKEYGELDRSEVEWAVKHLKRAGDAYEPEEDSIRVT